MTTQIQLGAIESTAVSSLQGPRITSVTITDNTYMAIDDTAVDSTSGGYIKITGTGFVSGCIVAVGNITATSTTFVSSTEVRAQLGAQAAGSYNLYVSNPDGSLSIKVLGINYSGLPSWTTSANQTFADAGVSFQFAANSDSTVAYSVNTGSTLPGGLSLSSNGLLSGTVNGSSGTVYTFTLQATDTENQNTPRTFVVTLSFTDPYFNYTTLLIHADGANAANNNTFIDSSTNAFTITKAGTPIQGTSSPFSQSGWSNHFNGSADYLGLGTTFPAAMGSGTSSNYTVECWVYLNALPTGSTYSTVFPILGFGAIYGMWSIANNGYLFVDRSGAGYVNATGAIPAIRTWNHLAFVNSGTTMTIYLNGTSVATCSLTGTWVATQATYIGTAAGYSYFNGYISNLRVTTTAVYTGSFTPSTTPLTAITGTILLTCQNNRFKDNSTNAFTLTPTGVPSVQSFSPFGGSSTYSTSLVGGSTYFNGTTDSLSAAHNSLLDFSSGGGTIEFWAYPLDKSTLQMVYTKGIGIQVYISSGSWYVAFSSTNSGTYFISASFGTVTANAWQHIAITYNGSNYYAYLNGQQTSLGASASIPGTGTDTLYIGRYGATAYYYTGYMSNVRFVKGSAVYTSAFIPPTAPITAIANTSLLVNSTNAAIYDQTSKNNLLTAGSTQISTAQYKFGTGSMYFNGSTDYITTAGTSQLLLFGTGAFTIEHWVKFTATTAYINSIGDNSHFTTTNNFLFMWNYAGAGRLSFWINNAVVCSTTNAYNNDAWHHVAVTRTAAGAITIWVDGVADGTGTNSAALGTGSLIIGNQAQVSRYWAGYIDEVRVTRGYARYTTAFTPTSSAFNDR